MNNTTISLYHAGIIGTKEYRKPEWVTQMEEMQEALRGKNNFNKINKSTCVSMFRIISQRLVEEKEFFEKNRVT